MQASLLSEDSVVINSVKRPIYSSVTPWKAQTARTANTSSRKKDPDNLQRLRLSSSHFSLKPDRYTQPLSRKSQVLDSAIRHKLEEASKLNGALRHYFDRQIQQSSLRRSKPKPDRNIVTRRLSEGLMNKKLDALTLQITRQRETPFQQKRRQRYEILFEENPFLNNRNPRVF